MQQVFPYDYFEGYGWARHQQTRVAKHPERAEIERRLKVLVFFEKHGALATQDAFCVSRSTVYSWKRKLKESRGRLVSLAPGSTAPHRVRRRTTHHMIVDFQ